VGIAIGSVEFNNGGGNSNGAVVVGVDDCDGVVFNCCGFGD
jgi:hypothetical protein